MGKRGFRWYFSCSFVDEFARTVALDMQRTWPPKGSRTGAMAEGKRERKLEKASSLIQRRVADFHRAEKLNLFQRARMSQRLQNELLALGYPVDFARDVAMRSARSVL